MKATVGTYNLGDGTLNINQGSAKFTANFSIGGVFSAKLAGAIYYGTVPAGTTISGPGGTQVAAKSGDFVISAKDVTLNLGGFASIGTVEVGLANGTPWGNLSTKIQLLGSGDANSIAIAGSFSGNGDFSFAGRANLDLLGAKTSFGATVKKTGTALSIRGDATVAVLGSNIALAGDFAYNNGTPRFRLTGSGALNLSGYNVARAAFTYSNFPEDAGLSADVNVQAGSVLNFSRKLSIAGNLYYINANARLDLRVLTADGNVTLTNCNFGYAYKSPQPQINDYNPIRYLTVFGSFRIPQPGTGIPNLAYIQALIKWQADNSSVKPSTVSRLSAGRSFPMRMRTSTSAASHGGSSCMFSQTAASRPQPVPPHRVSSPARRASSRSSSSPSTPTSTTRWS